MGSPAWQVIMSDSELHPQETPSPKGFSAPSSETSEGSSAPCSEYSGGIFCSILRDFWRIICSMLRVLRRDLLLNPQTPEGSFAVLKRLLKQWWISYSVLKRLLGELLLHPQSDTPGGSYAPSSMIFCFVLRRFLKDHPLHTQGLLGDLLLSPRDSRSSEGSPSPTLSSRDFWGIFCSILRDSWGIFC